MRYLLRLTLTIGAAVLFAGCGGSQPPIGTPGAKLQAPASALAQAPRHRILHSSSSYQLLHRFPGTTNGGFNPQASVIDVHGTLYGTTKYGGGSTNCIHGCGTVFSLDASGNENVLHSFTGGSDGAYPAAALLDVKGKLYGTTEGGGDNEGGTVFSIRTTGEEHVLHSFAGGSDGSNPEAPLIDVNGTLYGTTVYGGNGSSPNGTVYSVTTSGVVRVLHYFTCGSGDGCLPIGGLISVNGTLYGTTAQGGKGCSGGCGVVYSISASGSENVLYRFAGGSDGQQPLSSLVNVNGTLYGTTREGGSSACKYGCGTAYSITTTGTEQVVYRFAGGRDGALPQAGLINVNGTLYGTTISGGGTSCTDQFYFDYHGCGTIYSLTTSGDEKVLFRFKSEYVGEPAASLVNVGSVLFGTTPRVSNRKCGAHGMTCGTVFAFTL